MTNSRSIEWAKIRDLEDIMALLAKIDTDRDTIKRHAWNSGHVEIFQASERQRRDLAQLRQALSAQWHHLTGEARD